MKNSLCLFTFAFLYIFPLQGQIARKYSEQLSVLDSLLLQCDTTSLSEVLHSDSFGKNNISSFALSSWDSIKYSYVSVLADITSTLSQSIENKKNVLENAQEMEHRYRKQDVGEKASLAYEKFKDAYFQGNVDSALFFLVVANYFRIRYINEVKQYLSLNADSIKEFLNNAELEVCNAQQDQATGSSFSSLDKAHQLMDIYNTQNRQSPVYRSLSNELINQYKDLEQKLNKLQGVRLIERNSDYRELKFTIGASFGGLYSISEPYPLFTDLGWYRNRYILRYANEAVSTYSASANISYYMKKNLSLELLYRYAKAYFQPPNNSYYSGTMYSFYPQQTRPIFYSSISLMTNYLFRIKTGLRPLVGIGLSYSSIYVSQVELKDMNQLRYISDAQRRNSFRVLARSGFEYIPNAASFLSYSILIDFSTNIKSNKEVSLFMIEPSMRISWLIR
jgi:outer membrane protein W